MAQANIRVQVRSGGKTYSSLNAWAKEITERDLPALVPVVAAEELAAQRAGGNEPSHILVDGKPATEAGIANAKRRVQLFFLDVELLTRAVLAAYEELRRLYTHKTGEAAASIQIWGRFVRGGVKHERLSGPGAVRDWLAAHRHAGTYIRLLGPDVPHRRFLYYSPPGARSSFRSVTRFSQRRLTELERAGSRARTVAKKRGRGKLVQIESKQNVNEIVTRKLASTFGGALYISGTWLAVPVPPWKGMQKRKQGVPGMALGWKLRGAL